MFTFVIKLYLSHIFHAVNKCLYLQSSTKVTLFTTWFLFRNVWLRALAFKCRHNLVQYVQFSDCWLSSKAMNCYALNNTLKMWSVWFILVPLILISLTCLVLITSMLKPANYSVKLKLDVRNPHKVFNELFVRVDNSVTQAQLVSVAIKSKTT